MKKLFTKLGSLGWKVWMGLFTGIGVLAGLAFKLWDFFQNRRTAQDVVDTANKKVEEAHADDVAVKVEVAKAEERVEVVGEKIEAITEAAAPESDERIDDLTAGLAEMTRRRHAEEVKKP